MSQETAYAPLKAEMIPALNYLGLSLSSACGANCVFCPSDRGTRIKQKIMPFEVARKAIDDVSVRTDTTAVDAVSFGENGDAFINKNALDIFRYAKEKLPDACLFCVTNFQNLTPEAIDTIVREGLLKTMSFNMDGASESGFFATKRISIDHVRKKLSLVLEAREKYNSDLAIGVSILTARRYAEATMAVLGRLPSKMQDPSILQLEDETEEIRSHLLSMLRPTDGVSPAAPFFWAERAVVDKSAIDYKNHICPMVARVAQQAYIAPDGTWYACCFDADNKLVIGNIMTTPIRELVRSEARRALIEKLVYRRFAEIGDPCDTVNCCTPVAIAPVKS